MGDRDGTRPTRLTGAEPFHDAGQRVEHVFAFWPRYGPDRRAPATCGIVAGFLVAIALGIAKGLREEWAAHDLTTEEGIRIEVKSAAYVQSWAQARPSRIIFGIRPSQRLDADANTGAGEAKRQADVYVFALLATRERAAVDPLDVSQWRFYVLPTRVLDDTLGTQETIGLAGLERLGAEPVAWRELASAVQVAGHNARGGL